MTLLNNGVDAGGWTFHLGAERASNERYSNGHERKNLVHRTRGERLQRTVESALVAETWKILTADLTFTVKGSGAITYTPMVVAGTGGRAYGVFIGVA